MFQKLRQLATQNNAKLCWQLTVVFGPVYISDRSAAPTDHNQLRGIALLFF